MSNSAEETLPIIDSSNNSDDDFVTEKTLPAIYDTAEETLPIVDSSNNSDDDFVTEKTLPAKEVKKKITNGRFIYLITYSKADLLRVASREKFAQIICDEFNRNNDDVVLQWACCVENHTERGVHFHMSIKLKARRRFGEVRDNLQSKYGICVNFREWMTFYYDAFTYVAKQDPHYIKSEGHPPLDNSPLTRKAVQHRRRSRVPSPAGASSHTQQKGKEESKKKKPRLDANQLFQLVIDNDIKTDIELCAMSKVQFDEGKSDLNRYIMTNSEKNRTEMIKTAWKINNSKDIMARANKSRMQLLQDAKSFNHASDCVDNRWLTSALEVLQMNNIDSAKFTSDVRELLEHGRGKGRCLMIYGDTNRAKSFILMPLRFITRLCALLTTSLTGWGPGKKR